MMSYVYPAKREYESPRAMMLSILADLGWPAVKMGGGGSLSEEFYDAGRAIDMKAIESPVYYDVMLCGGEPYALWI